MHGSHNFSIKSDLVGAAQWCVYERPFVNMHILSNEEALNVSVDQWKSFFSLLTQIGLWVKWSNCPFYRPPPPPPPISASPALLIRPLTPTVTQYLRVPHSTHISTPGSHTLILLRDKTIISAPKARNKGWDELLHLHTSIDCLKKGWILATSMRKVFTIHTFKEVELLYPRLFWGIQIADCILFPRVADPLQMIHRILQKKHSPSILKDLN